MAELKGQQRREAEGKLQRHSRLTLMARVLVCNLKVRIQGLTVFCICVVECLHIMVYHIHFFSHSAMS